MNKGKQVTYFLIALFLIVISLYPSDLKLIKTISQKSFENFTNFSIHEENIHATTFYSIITYDLNGRLIQKVGQKGEGPGEFALISSLVITDEEFIVSDGIKKKIVFFTKNGELKKEVKTEYQIEKLITIEDHLFYLAFVSQKSEKEKRIDYFLKLFRLNDGKELISFADESKTFAVNPAGKKLPFPWFPAPYYNRKILLKGEDGRLRIFYSKERYFHLYENGKFVKINYESSLEAKPIDKNNKDAFFEYIEAVNRIKYPDRTKKSVVFPKSQEYFLGAMTWGDNFALIAENSFIIVSDEGKLIEEIYFPEGIKVDNRWDFIYPERRLNFYKKCLYYYDEYKECLKVFNISPP